jgi:hypothetical protein
MHARCELVVDAQMAARIFADLDDVLSDRVAANQLIALVQRKRKRDLRLALAIHREKPSLQTRSVARRRMSRSMQPVIRL